MKNEFERRFMVPLGTVLDKRRSTRQGLYEARSRFDRLQDNVHRLAVNDVYQVDWFNETVSMFQDLEIRIEKLKQIENVRTGKSKFEIDYKKRMSLTRASDIRREIFIWMEEMRNV